MLLSATYCTLHGHVLTFVLFIVFQKNVFLLQRNFHSSIQIYHEQGNNLNFIVHIFSGFVKYMFEAHRGQEEFSACEVWTHSLEIISTYMYIHVFYHYTAKNATDLMQVVDFTSLMQVANKLYQAC